MLPFYVYAFAATLMRDFDYAFLMILMLSPFERHFLLSPMRGHVDMPHAFADVAADAAAADCHYEARSVTPLPPLCHPSLRHFRASTRFMPRTAPCDKTRYAQQKERENVYESARYARRRDAQR